ncbi:hypothetical protein [Photobacterium carnosum]|uniref:hypothetical protein n=1 Tax=Photobacterium carnosum TaxID=2023717 RepID=UPI001E4B0B87|nr:hypothetical protein [Photobacterium carnosum]MCD9513871.1 hypothetical protein [Photobacterium carnosum]
MKTNTTDLELLSDYMRTPLKIVNYFFEQPNSIKTGLQEEAVSIIKEVFDYELDNNVTARTALI